jgi:hypothetical protein
MLTKYLMPLVAIASFAGGSFFGVKVLDKKCPDLKCPEVNIPPAKECPPCNGIDFDKIKSKYITIQNEQHLTVSGDSLFAKKIVDDLKAEMKALKLSKCK